MKKPKNIPTYYTSKGTPIFRDTTALLFNNGGPVNPAGPVNTLQPILSESEMKAKIAYEAALGNSAAQRMLSLNPKTYDFGDGNFGTHFMMSAGNYAVPILQDTGKPNLEYIENPPPGKEDFKFSTPEQADYFAENYKTVSPMITRQYADGGPLHDRDINGKLLQSTYASALGNMFREGGPFGEDQGVFDYATSIYASQPGNYYAQGGMIKRADGSYSQRGLWDNIRANRGSGKEPTKEMLAQEKKINREYRTGGQFPRPYSLPEDNFKQGGTNLHNSVYASSSAPYPGIYAEGGTLLPPDNAPAGTPFNLANRNSWMGNYSMIPQGHNLSLPLTSLPGIGSQITSGAATANFKTVGDYVTAAENWERNQAGSPIAPGPVNINAVIPSTPLIPEVARTNYYTDPYTGQVVKDFNPATGVATPREIPNSFGNTQYANYLEKVTNSPAAKENQQALEAERLNNIELLKTMTPEQKAAMRAAGLTPAQYLADPFSAGATKFSTGGELVVAGGEKHRIYKKISPTGNGEGIEGHIMVNHPTKDKGQWDTIDLTTKAGAKTVAEGIAATKQWHKENPNQYAEGGMLGGPGDPIKTQFGRTVSLTDQNEYNKRLQYYNLSKNLQNYINTEQSHIPNNYRRWVSNDDVLKGDKLYFHNWYPDIYTQGQKGFMNQSGYIPMTDYRKTPNFYYDVQPDAWYHIGQMKGDPLTRINLGAPELFPYWFKPILQRKPLPEIGKLITKKLPQIETEIIPNNYNYIPQKYEPIQVANRSQTIMEADPDREGKYRVKELRQVPYSANFPGEGWQPANAPRVLYIDSKGNEVEEIPKELKQLDLKGETFAEGGSILSMSNTPQLEGEGKDLTYPNGAYVYGRGGVIKTSQLFAGGGPIFPTNQQLAQFLNPEYQRITQGQEVTVHPNSAQQLLIDANKRAEVANKNKKFTYVDPVSTQKIEYDSKQDFINKQKRNLSTGKTVINQGDEIVPALGTALEFTGVPAGLRTLDRLKENPLTLAKNIGTTAVDLATLPQNLAYEGANYLFGNNKFNLPIDTEALSVTADAASLLPFIPKGTSKAIKQGAKIIGDDIGRGYNYVTTQTPLRNAYNYNPLANRTVPMNRLFHGTDNPNLLLDDIKFTDPNPNVGPRPGTFKQRAAASGDPLEMPGGFYTNDRSVPGFMGNNNYRYSMDVPANAKVFKWETGPSDNISVKRLQELKNEGYDIIQGKNIIGEIEYIPLKKDLISNWKLHQKGDPELKLLKDLKFKIEQPHWLKGYKEVPIELPSSPNTFTRSGLGGVDMSNYVIKNPDYYTQLLNTYNSKALPAANRKFYKDLIANVKKQDGVVTERQLNELKRLATGNFDFGKKAYNMGGQARVIKSSQLFNR